MSIQDTIDNLSQAVTWAADFGKAVGIFVAASMLAFALLAWMFQRS